MTVREIDEKYVASTYARFPVCLKSGKGSLVYDENGKELVLNRGKIYVAVNYRGKASFE